MQMTWNWQHPQWPDFDYDINALLELESQFNYQAGLTLGVFDALPESEQTRLRVELITEESDKTSQIEGELLNRDSIQSSIRHQFGLETSTLPVGRAEQGVAQMMVEVYQQFDQPLSTQTLFNWHARLMQGRTDLSDVGHYRSHSEPMQVVSGPDYRRKIHFEAPPSSRVAPEMKRYIRWYNQSRADPEMPTLLRSGLAHLYFESIHPFEDGNGRVGRALSEKALSQRLGRPALISLSSTLEAHRRRYYDALTRNNQTLKVDDWLDYFGKTVIQAMANTQTQVWFLIDKAKFFDQHRAQLNTRQEKALLKMFAAGPAGFEGGMSAEKYRKITHTSASTATRDLSALEKMGALTREGKLKHTRFYLWSQQHQRPLTPASTNAVKPEFQPK